MAHRPVRSSRSRTIAKRGRRVPTIAIVALPKRHRLDAPSPIKRRTACRVRSRSVRRSRIGPAARPHRHEPLTTARSLWPLRRRPLRRRSLWTARSLRSRPLRSRPPSSPRGRIGRMRKIAPALNDLDRPSKTRSPDAIRHAIGRRRRHGPPEQRARVRPARPGVVLTRRARQTSSPDAPPRAPAWPGAPPIAWPVARWRLPVCRAGREWTPGLRRVRSRRQSSVSRQGSWRVARAQMHRRRPMTNWPALSSAVVSWPRRANLLVPSLLRLRNPVVIRPSAPPAPAAT